MTLLPLHKRLATSRLELHHAAQIPAASSCLLDASDDYGHTTLSLEDSRLCAQPLPDGRRVCVDVRTLDLSIETPGAPTKSFYLEGRLLGDGLAWLSSQLGQDIPLLTHELPARPDAPFIVTKANAQLHEWLALGTGQIGDAMSREDGGPVRLWPHHFDLATLVALDEQKGEEAKSINIGISFGDDSYDEPYWYVTPWPTPAELPALEVGRWHRDGFTAAVLEASQSGEEPGVTATAFIEEAVKASREALGERKGELHG